MKKRLPLLLSVVFGLLAAGLAYVYLQKQRADMGEMQAYLAASAAIPKGAKLSRENLAIQRVPRKFAPLNAIKASDRANVIGGEAALDIRKGQVIVWEYVEAGMAGRSLSDRLAKGERAMTLAVDNISGLSGMIRPNDRVDIIGTFSTGERSTSCVLNQCVTVLAVGRRTEAGESDYSSVTLKVTPEEAEILTFAQSHGQLRLILRNPKDLDIQPDLPAVDFSNILSLQRQTNTGKAIHKPKITYN